MTTGTVANRSGARRSPMATGARRSVARSLPSIHATSPSRGVCSRRSASNRLLASLTACAAAALSVALTPALAVATRSAAEASAAARPGSVGSTRPSSPSRELSRRSAESFSASVTSARAPARRSRPASCRSPTAVTSAPSAFVAMRSNACASSTTRTSCGGSKRPPAARCAAYRAWFTTTMSTDSARKRARSAKHSTPWSHRVAPGHSFGPQVTARHDAGATASPRSATSPVSLSSANSCSAARSSVKVGPGRSSNNASVSDPCSRARQR